MTRAGEQHEVARDAKSKQSDGKKKSLEEARAERKLAAMRAAAEQERVEAEARAIDLGFEKPRLEEVVGVGGGQLLAVRACVLCVMNGCICI